MRRGTERTPGAADAAANPRPTALVARRAPCYPALLEAIETNLFSRSWASNESRRKDRP